MGEQRRRKSGGRNRIWGERQIHTQIYQRKGGKKIVMDIALAIVDLPAQNLPEQNPLAQNKTDWGCGLTARKEENYKHRSKAKRKRRRYVPADRVYYIQSANPLQ